MTEQTPAELESENETLREDAEEYNNRIEDLQGEVERLTAELAAEKKRQDDYEENQVGDANEAAINAARTIAELETKLKTSEELVLSLRLNGAGHWYTHAHDKFVEEEGRRVSYCAVCKKDEGHPSHFQSAAQYLDSRQIEKAAQEAQERLCDLVVTHMRLGHRQALQVARTVLEGLPGITEPQKGINVLPRLCNACGRPENDHNVRHPFSWGSQF